MNPKGGRKMVLRIFKQLASGGHAEGPFRKRPVSRMRMARVMLSFYCDGDRRAKAGLPELSAGELARLARVAGRKGFA